MKMLTGDKRLLNWPEYPLVRVIGLFIVGIFLSTLITIPSTYSIGLTLALFLVVLLLHKSKVNLFSVTRTRSVLLLLLFFFIGFLRGSFQKSDFSAYHFKHLIESKHNFSGQIVSEPQTKKSTSVLMDIQTVDSTPSRGKMIVYFNKADSAITYELGDVIAFSGWPNTIENNLNPRSFDYKRLMQHKGIEYRAFLQEGAHALIKKDNVFLPLHYASKIRKWSSKVLKERLLINDQFATASAMILGDREHISEELKTAFSETGAVHVLAVSGLHVGIILFLFRLLFDKVRSTSNRTKVIRFITLLSVVTAYTLITGASPAVIRAAVMFVALEAGRLWYDNTNVYNILAFSAFVILMYDPYYLFQLGFIFSYLALISIVFFQPYVMAFIERRIHEPKSKLSTRIWQLVSVSIAAQVLIFPISVFFFHKFPIYFILSGVMAVALAPFILSIGLGLLIVHAVPILGTLFAVALRILLNLFLATIYGIHSLPLSFENIHISQSSMILMYIAILASMFVISYRVSGVAQFRKPDYTSRILASTIVACSLIGLMYNSVSYSYRTNLTNEFVIYDYQNSTLIDIFYGGEVASIRADSIDLSKMKYTNQEYRIYQGNPAESIIEPTLDSIYHNFATHESGLLVFDNELYLFTHQLDIDMPFPKRSDYLLIVMGSELLPYRFLDYHSTKKVIIDNSVTSKLKNQWKKECKKRGIAVHVIREDGVFKKTT